MIKRIKNYKPALAQYFKYPFVFLVNGIAEVFKKRLKEIDNSFNSFPRPSDEYCVGCDVCFYACPSHAITVKDEVSKRKRTIVWNYDRCISCGICSAVCPEEPKGVSMDFKENISAKDKIRMFSAKEFGLIMCEVCGKGMMTAEQLVAMQEREDPSLLMRNPVVLRYRSDLIKNIRLKVKKNKGIQRSDRFLYKCTVCRNAESWGTS